MTIGSIYPIAFWNFDRLKSSEHRTILNNRDNRHCRPQYNKTTPVQSERLRGKAALSLGINICTNRPKRSITKPKAINVRLVRVQASNVCQPRTNTPLDRLVQTLKCLALEELRRTIRGVHLWFPSYKSRHSRHRFASRCDE